MKYALSCVNGELKYNLTKEELLEQLILETKRMEEDDILIIYPMVDGSKIRIGTDILAVHLLNGELDVYGVKDTVFSSLFNNMTYSEYYNTIREVLDEFEKKQPIKESRAFEQEQFEQAEAAKESADYRVHIGGNIFRFTGETAADLVYAVIKGIFSSVSRDDDIITIHDAMNGNKYGIAYAKGLAKAVITINGRTRYFDYYIPHELSALMNFIKEVVIL